MIKYYHDIIKILSFIHDKILYYHEHNLNKIAKKY